MALRKLEFKPGINREKTRATNAENWYECDKVRFRQGFPEKINGWSRISANTFLGVCRSLWNWVTLTGLNLVGVGTNIKFYIEKGGAYYDITPLRATASLTNPFDTTDTLTTVVVNDTAHGAIDGDYVTFSGASAVGGITIDGEYQITYIDADTYSIEHSSAATSTVTGGGGTVTAAYQINIGSAIAVPAVGWGSGPWGSGPWGGGGAASTTKLRQWSQGNFGEDLILAYRGGKPYYWDATGGLATRAVQLDSLTSASEVPAKVNMVMVSDINRFVFAFGCSDEGSSTLDPMLIRWSDQEQAQIWKAGAANQAGGLRVSHGSEIITGIQARQEVLVWTDSSLYGLQYLGAPDVWGAQLLGDNISIVSQNAPVHVNGAAFWMGKEQFYMYDGTVKVLPCDVRKYVYNDFNLEQTDQIFAGLNEAFSEIWWFYCSEESTTIDKYVVFNYKLGVWYYGTLTRTAWLDANLRSKPLAATYSNNLVYHETGLDDNETGTPAAIEAYIASGEFAIDDGDRFAFIRRVLPDITFDGSTAVSPSVTMTLYPLKNAGADYKTVPSEGGTNTLSVTQGTTVNIEPFTGQAFVRVRGRQMVFKVESSSTGVTWQLGTPKLDMRTDGRR